MSKKIISAILVMAMVISMSATALLSSVGAAAETETNYQADVDNLIKMLKEFVVEGPVLADETIDYLKALDIIHFNGDLNCSDGCGEYVELHNRNSFWKNYNGANLADVNSYFFRGTAADKDLAKKFVENGDAKFNGTNGNGLFANTGLTWDKTPDADETYADLAQANISTVIEYAASVVYFGKNADDVNPDPSFNEGRNAVVKKAAGMVNALLDLLAKEVTATEKPAAYAAEFDGQWYRGFATSSKAYNQAIGFNPYFFILEQQVTEDGNYYGKNYYEDNYYGTVLGQYTVRWYTFAEAREIDAEGVFAFENAIRTMAIENCAGVLFYDFINDKEEPFLDIVESLFENLVGKVENSFVTEDVDTQIKAFLKLKLIVEKVYDLYIKDVYNNIYTASSAELLNDVLYAKRLIEYITAESTNSRLIALALADFTTLTNDIIAGIKAVAPRSEQLLTAAEITEGTALVRKAEALLNNWASWESNDSYKGAWGELKTAMNNLKNMLPTAEGENAVIVIAADSDKMKNIAGTEIGNDRIVVEFAPNWFAYIKLYALLENEINEFMGVITGVNGSLSSPNLEASSKSDLVDTINKYANLIGIVGNVVEFWDHDGSDSTAKVVRLVPTTDADGKATKNFVATEKYIGYLFDNNAIAVTGFDRTEGALPSFAYVNAKPGSTTAISKWSDTYDAASTCYVSEHYNQNYTQVIGDLMLYNYVSNVNGKVDSIYENVIGYVDGNNVYDAKTNSEATISQDVAIDSVYVLMQTIVDAAIYAENKDLTDWDHSAADINTVNNYSAQWDWSAEYEFDSQGKFDWVNDQYVFTSGNDKAINAIVEAVKNLTKDLTTEIQTYTAIMQSVANLFGWDLTVQGYVADTDTQWCKTANDFPKDAMKNALAATNALAQNISDTIVDKDSKNIYNYTTAAQIIAAYDAFVDAIKTYLFTAEGAAKFDEFVEDVYYFTKSYLGEDGSWNEYDKLLQKLIESKIDINNYYIDQKNCYEYFAVTLAHVSGCDRFFGNRYNAESGALAVNLINPLKEHTETMDVTGYTRDWADMYNTVRQIAAGVVLAAEDTTSDMPVWYAERVLSECNEIKASASDYTTAGLVEYKAGLEALLIEADGLNVYNYTTATEEAAAIWAAFVEAYSNAQLTALDTRCSKSDVDEAVAALEAAMADLEKIEAAEGAADADALAAKIEAAEAVYARADATTADKSDLEVAIAAAKKVLQFNISVLNATDIEAEIKTLDDAMNALLDTMYTGADLAKATKVIELQVVVDLYTEASYANFAEAVEAAYAMAEEDTASESAMMAAIAEVEARFGDLKLAPVEEAEEEPTVSVVMEQAIAIYNEAADGYDKAVEGCTAETAAAYNAAINTLKADIENEADDAKLLESIIALNLAKAALTVDVPETCDC